MNKKIVKLAVIRKDAESPCPFGLTIPMGCSIAGEIIDKMAPLSVLGQSATEDEKQKLIAANSRVLVWTLMQDGTQPAHCKYAAKIFEQKNGVDCSYSDTAAGEEGGAALIGSPSYGNQFNGMFSAPIGYFSEFNGMRNSFYGIYSIQGSAEETALKTIELPINLHQNEISPQKGIK